MNAHSNQKVADRSTKSITELVNQMTNEFRGLERNLQNLENTTPLLGSFPMGTTPRVDHRIEKLMDSRGGAQPYLPEMLDLFREHIFFISQHISQLDIFFREQYGLPSDPEPTTTERTQNGYADIPRGSCRG